MPDGHSQVFRLSFPESNTNWTKRPFNPRSITWPLPHFLKTRTVTETVSQVCVGLVVRTTTKILTISLNWGIGTFQLTAISG
jgi:hypothetical protein